MRIVSKKHKKRIRVVLIVALAVALSAAAIYGVNKLSERQDDEYAVPNVQREDVKLSDVQSLYKDEDIDKVYTVYITTYTGPDADSGEIYDFDGLNAQKLGDADPILSASAYVTDSAENIVAGENNGKINCSISMRGQSSRNAEQKSYKIKFDDTSKTFEGQKVLNLNKHLYDATRITQKFCFDLMKDCDGIVSLRTNFVRLYVKDGTKSGGEYVDYGLFTHVEQPNKSFLRAHGLDENGTLYKPSDFEFYPNDAIVESDSEEFDYEQFKLLLKIRENPDNVKLKRMIDDVNNYDLDFDDVFAKYFDEDNYLTWFAINLLVNNYDTMSRNYLLYSPSNSSKWYFLPWDYDASMLTLESYNEKSIASFTGLSRYWGTVLHNRYFRNPEHVKKLEEKIDTVYAQFMNTDLSSRLTRYATVAQNNIFGSADEKKYKHSYNEIMRRALDYPATITQYYNLYYSSKERPMPVFLGKEKYDDDGFITLNWSPSYDLQGDRLTYSLNVYTSLTSPETSSVYKTETSLAKDTLKDVKLPDGTYFWSIKISDSAGHSQIAFDRITVSDNNIRTAYVGVKKFVIKNGELEKEDTTSRDVVLEEDKKDE